MERTM